MSQVTNNSLTATLVSLVAPIVSDLKLDLYDLEFNGGVVKITVDTPPGSAGGVTLEQLALVARLAGRDFDHHDPIPGRYTLEVTSPGLERTLRTAAHFRRELGKTVNIRLRATVDGERRIQGLLVAADESTAVVLDANGAERVVRIDMVDRAKTVFQWEKGAKRVAPDVPRKSKAAAGAKPARGPSDELDTPIEQEATA